MNPDHVFRTRRPYGLILIYHRVALLEQDPQLLAVSPGNFEAQIAFLSRHYHLIPLNRMVEALEAGQTPENSVAITFDDGYEDNFKFALPILEKYKAPATLFVTSGKIGSNLEFWWDELERTVLEKEGSGSLSFAINGKSFSFNANSPGGRRALYNSLHPLIKHLGYAERESLIARIIQWTASGETGRETHRPLTAEQIRSMAASPCIEIGSHTVHHSRLSSETETDQWNEISQSRSILESLIEKPVTSFSYPFGGSRDFGPGTVAMVKRAGYRCGIANFPGPVLSGSDRFQLPRFLIRNWDINEFRIQMDGFVRVLHPLDKWRHRFERIFDPVIAPAYFYLKIRHPARNFPPAQAVRPSNRSVLHIGTTDVLGGAAKLAFRLHKGIKSNGIPSALLVDRALSNDPDVSVLERDFTRRQKQLYRYQDKMGWLDCFHLAPLRLAEHPAVQAAGVLHFHNLHGGYFNPFILPELAALKPCLWTLHDMQALTGHCAHSLECNRWINGCGGCPDLTLYPAIRKDQTARLWRWKADLIRRSRLTLVCPSRWLQNKVNQSLMRHLPTHLIYNGVDVDIFHPSDKNNLRRILGLPDKGIVICFAAVGGEDNIWKGGAYIRETFNALKDLEDVFFLCIGGPGSHPIEHPRWFYTGYVADEFEMARYLSASDLFLYPSIADTCPLVVLEAMACGTPVAAFRTGGIPELIEDGKSGWLTDCRDGNKLIRLVLELIHSRALSDSVSKTCTEEIQRRFTIIGMVNRYQRLYESLFTANPSSR